MPASQSPKPLLVEFDKNPRTNQPWECIAADGKSTVRIMISAPGAESVTYSMPESQGILTPFRTLSKGLVTHAKGRLKLHNGKNELFFHPPKFTPVNKPFMTKKVKQNRILRYSESEITISVKNKNGQKSEVKKNIQYCRAPVFLVHGFTGDRSTWELLGQMLSQKGFITHRENYYFTSTSNGTQDIQAQAEFLGKMIRLEMDVYEKSNVMFRKADIVAHSMGGLISRYYTKNYPQYAGDVRKIIMVGTPNHGIYKDKELAVGEFAAWWNESHKGMAKNVEAGSPVISQINTGEKTGAHLHRQIEYGNIYVDGTDGVVEGRSARLNGVKEVMLTQMKHSPSIPNVMGHGNKSITTDWMVFGKILGWLNNTIEPGTLNMNQWNTHQSVQAGEEVDLSGLGHFLKVHSGEIKLNKDLKKFSSVSGTNAEVIYPDGTKFNILPNINISYNNDLNEIIIIKGTAIFNVKKQKKQFVVISPSLRAGVRGTCFEVETSSGGNTKILLYEGELEITNLSGTHIIKTGEYIETGDPNFLYKRTFEPKKRFHQVWTDFPGMKDLNSFMGKRHPLFANVRTGGNLANPVHISAGTTPVNTTSCLNSLSPKFIKKIEPTSDPKGQMIAKKINDDNQREVFLFNKAKKDFKKGIIPNEMNGSYKYQKKSSVFSNHFNCQTTTIFVPMKITNVSGNARGFKLMREGKVYKNFKSNSDAVGIVLPCGSYKAYPKKNSSSSAFVKLTLEKIF